MKKELGYLVLGGVLASVLTGGLVYAQTNTSSKTTGQAIAPCHQERGNDGIFGKMDKEQMLQNHAQILGMTVEELQAALDAGQNFQEIAESKGITPEQMQTQMKAHLSELVASGTITQAQMDEHLERMANKPVDKGFGMHAFGVHNGKGIK